VLIIQEFLTARYLVFLVEASIVYIPKLREFLHNESKTLFRISLHFLTNLKYSHRVSTSNFSRNYSIDES